MQHSSLLIQNIVKFGRDFIRARKNLHKHCSHACMFFHPWIYRIFDYTNCQHYLIFLVSMCPLFLGFWFQNILLDFKAVLHTSLWIFLLLSWLIMEGLQAPNATGQKLIWWSWILMALPNLFTADKRWTYLMTMNEEHTQNNVSQTYIIL